jgi:hypothetical protein
MAKWGNLGLLEYSMSLLYQCQYSSGENCNLRRPKNFTRWRQAKGNYIQYRMLDLMLGKKYILVGKFKKFAGLWVVGCYYFKIHFLYFYTVIQRTLGDGKRNIFLCSFSLFFISLKLVKKQLQKNFKCIWILNLC